MVWPLALKKPGLWDRGMASDIRMRTAIEKKTPVWQTVVRPLGLKKTGLSNWGVANGVTKFRMASGEKKKIYFRKNKTYFFSTRFGTCLTSGALETARGEH